jgi:hypothetical protein
MASFSLDDLPEPTNSQKIWWSISRFFSNIYWWIRYHTVSRYHCLSLRQKEYKYGWIDCDAQIIFAVGNILRSFVEKERGGEKNMEKQIANMERQVLEMQDENSQNNFEIVGLTAQADSDKKVLELYRWFVYKRPEWSVHTQDGYDSEEEQWLIDVIKIRHHLWT